ncbi:MAG: substrate-binding domain-containing protein [Gammaproteobacteria bacterium]
MAIPNKRILVSTAAAAICFLGAGINQAEARDQLRIVGSSTVYPFSSYVAEELGAVTDWPTPVVESTGSGGGMELFCKGAAANTPDITNSSRRMEAGEFEICQENGVTDITEALIGYDGIVVANSMDGPDLELTLEEIFLAVAAEVPQDGELVANPYQNWSEINPDLPDEEIVIYGPPTTSGTRDAFEELVMEVASEEMEEYEEAYTAVRDDGPYVPAGENDNLIVQRIEQDPGAVGIFGYSFLEENADSIKAATINGTPAERELISSGEYPVARSLFFYIKNAHADAVPAMEDYVSLFMSDQMIGEDGLLKDIGLIPLPEDTLREMQESVADREKLEMSDLEG